MNPHARTTDDEFLGKHFDFDEEKWRYHLNFEARLGYDAWNSVNVLGPAARDFPDAAYYEAVGAELLKTPTMSPIISTLKAIQSKITTYLKEHNHDHE